MKFLIRIYDRCMAWTAPLQAVILLLIRAVCGWQFVSSGLQKLHNIPATAEYFQTLNIPQAQNMAWGVGGVETVCGGLLIAGLLARLAALPLVIIMLGSFMIVHTQGFLSIFSDFDFFTKQPPFLPLLGSLLILVFGPGKLSIDYFVRRKTGS